ncbi:MAG: molybdopterin-dependent oxidoreductase [Christensenellales bacterium]
MSLIDKLMTAGVTRRGFIKGSAATIGAAGMALAASGAVAEANALEKTAEGALVQPGIALEGGKWVNAACPHNCGGKCLVRAYIKDGVILRQKTDDFNSDDEVNRQQRACLRGWSQQYQARGLDRLKYPMKRKNWSPGNPNGHLRGQDEWERISWDEAAQYIADEIKRINDTYGDNAILCARAGNDVLNKADINYLSAWRTGSWGSWFVPGVLGWGDGCNYYDCNNDRLDMFNCEYVIGFGYNPAWSSLGTATSYAKAWKDAGVKFILFDPIYTDTAAILDAQWIPIRPGTDMAAMLAMAYVMLEEDSEANPLIDWDFLKRCCVGFDADHMPKDAKDEQNFFGYLRGEYDNTPKTPEWASEITGIPADTLREVARVLGKNNKVGILSSWATARTYNTEQLPQLVIALGAMGGHIGQSGHTVGPTAWNHTNNFGPRLIKAGSGGATGAVGGKGAATSVSETQQWKAVMGEPFNPTTLWSTLNGAGYGWKDAVADFDFSKRIENITANVKMIWNGAASRLTNSEGAKLGIEAHRAVEFVVGQGHFLTTTNKYSDIVLPITTAWEQDGTGYIWEGYYNRDILLISDKVIEPYFEAKSDAEASQLIGEKLGLSPDMWGTVPAKQRLFNSIATTTVIKEDGETWENLCAITEEDIKNWGVEGQPQEGRISIDKYMEDGLYRVERKVGDKLGFIHKKEFRDDPENNPISTASGKIEFYCQTYADMINSHGYSEEVYHGLPKYMPTAQGYESTFVDGDITGAKGEYPLQCMNPHYQRRAHSIFDNIPWLQEACTNPVFLSKLDAQERGIADGDTVKVSSIHGDTLRHACVTVRMMPGVVGLPHGKWNRVDEATGIDHGGSENYVTGNVATGLGVNGYNSLAVQVSKWDGDAIPADVDVPQTILF